jgi:ATP-binding cassette, subfamily B, bacterial
LNQSAENSSAGALAPPAAELAFPEPRALASRDVFRLPARAWPFIRPYRRHLAYLFLMMVPALPTGLFALMMIRVFYDVIGNGHPLAPLEAAVLRLPVGAAREAVLWHWCIAVAIAVVIALPYGSLMLGYGVWILQRMSNLFRVNLYTRLQELSLRFHSDEKIGDAIFRMFQDSAAIPQVIDGLVIQPIRFVPFVIANLVFLAMFDYRMAAIAMLLFPAQLSLAIAYGASLRRGFQRERETSAVATSRIEETLASIKAVKAFGTEASEAERYAAENWDSFIAARRARLMLARYRAWANTLRGLAYVAAAFVGARQVLIGGGVGLVNVAVSLGLFQGALSLLGGVTGRTYAITNLWGSLQDVAVAISRVLEMLAKPADERVASGSAIPPAAPRRLTFEQVGFSYDPRSPVLHEVSFEALAGGITALAGASGSGKSTIIALIVRFFDPTGGRIALDGRPIDDFDLTAWRGMLAVALQENPLFTASLRDNLRYGRGAATDEEIASAVARAGLADFVRSLPAGLDTMLGEKGAKLSVGQAQRLGLARALLRDAPILLLDEPTASLDQANEETVMRGVRDWIDERPARRMAIIATHRRSTAAQADRIYRIAAGRVEADDTRAREPAAARGR